jgi:PadR family transcriptional regulator, regulatory protein PadR
VGEAEANMRKPGAEVEEVRSADPWLEQVRRGGLELAILLALARAPHYGLEVIRRLGDTGLAVAEGTIYPILARLTRDGLLQSEWREEAAHPRKYYRLTASGRDRLRGMTAAWEDFAGKMARLIDAARGGDHAAR